MSISYIGQVGSYDSQRTPDPGSINYSASVDAGKTVVLLYGFAVSEGFAGTTGLTDSKGNVYKLAEWYASVPSPVGIATYVCKLSHAVTPSDTVPTFSTSLYIDGALTTRGPSCALFLAFDGVDARTVHAAVMSAGSNTGSFNSHLTVASNPFFTAGNVLAVGCFATYSAGGADHTPSVASPFTQIVSQPLFELGQEIPQVGYPNAGLLGDGAESGYLTSFYEIIPPGPASSRSPTVNISPECWFLCGVVLWIGSGGATDGDVDAVTNKSMTEKWVFRDLTSAGSQFVILERFELNSSAKWELQYSITVDGPGPVSGSSVRVAAQNPSVCSLPSGELSIAWCQVEEVGSTDTNQVVIATFTPPGTPGGDGLSYPMGVKYVATVATGISAPSHVHDKLHRVVVVALNTLITDWEVSVGTLNSDGKTYTFSAPVAMGLSDTDTVKGSLEALPDGSLEYTYSTASGNTKMVRCKSLTNAGRGTWA